MSGYAVWAALQADPYLLNGHQVIIFSAYRGDWRDFGDAARVLDKPFDMHTLVSVVSELAHRVAVH
jgi:hypothetical protein